MQRVALIKGRDDTGLLNCLPHKHGDPSPVVSIPIELDMAAHASWGKQHGGEAVIGGSKKLAPQLA